MSRDEARNLVGSLYDTWYSSLVRYAYRACGSLEAAEDAVQESFLALFRELVRGGRVDNPKAWTLCVLRREIVRAYREASRHDWSRLEGLRQPPAPEPADDKLDRLLAVLTQREEEVLMLRLRSLKYRQIAQELGIGLNSVKTLLARGLRKMREASQGTDGAMTGHPDQDADGEPLFKTLQ